MIRRLTLVVAVLFATGCASKPPASSDTQRPTEPAAPSVPLAPSAEALPPPDAREAALSRAVLDVLEHAHLLGKTIDDDVSRTAFATYLDRLDSGKLFLLAADRAALQKYADQIDDELRSGRLELAHDGAKIFVTRVEAVDAMIQKILAAPMNFSDEEYVELDPKKIEVATTDAELETRWRQRLELEVLERVAGMEDRLAADKAAAAHAKPKGKPAAPAPDAEPPADPTSTIPATPELREAKARADLAKAYGGRFARLRSPDKLDAASDLINAVTSALDPHTDYLPPAEKANFDIHMSGSLQGIGAVLRERDHYTEVAEIVPGGASARMGKLQAGDLILSVAQDKQEPVDIADMNINDVVAMIRGPKGTVVHLKVQKATGAQETYDITRDVVIVEETYARGAVVQKKGGPAYGYIYLPSFYGGEDAPRSASADVHRLLQEMHDRKVAGVVLDLRGNGGGFLDAAVDITGDLVDQGPVVQVRDGRGRRQVLADEQPGLDYDGPVVVMVDRFSASASEIVAGALQDYHRALIVGDGAQTHGKGTVQSLIDLDQGGPPTLGVLKVTVQQFFRPDGASTQLEGVKSDIALPDPDGHIESGERTLDRPIAFTQIEAAPHVDWKVTWDKDALARKSAARVAKQPILSRVATATAVLKTRLADTRVPLARAAWDARRAQQKRELDAAAPDLKAAPARFAVTSIADPGGVVDPVKDQRLARWREGLAKDPWVDETLAILGDMRAK
ncbi:MAG: carboxy terminal-processing peptidase [Deltaproteobacteria bacterium]|nr:carboxy terminal-processing peptidase [Deltaproteobacteria bacterium]